MGGLRIEQGWNLSTIKGMRQKAIRTMIQGEFVIFVALNIKNMLHVENFQGTAHWGPKEDHFWGQMSDDDD